ncbi:MAG: SRPBCC domain-containing protein [Chitinophagaceae bacterium]
MTGTLIARVRTLINANVSEVWKAITTPDTIRKYLLGANVTSTWKEGAPIVYKGEYNGKSYEDKGTILEFSPNHRLRSTYWSSMGGKEDLPENYNTVTYLLEEKGNTTELTLTQDNITSDKERENMISNWTSVLAKLKEVVESGG